MSGQLALTRSTVNPMQDSPEHQDAADVDESTRSSRFWLRLVENLFRRLPLYLLPVLLMGSVGVMLAQRATVEYVSSATLDASNNPLVDDVDIRGDDPLFRQTSAQSTASFIGEQLRTNIFIEELAGRAGLQDALEDGFIDNATIRSSVGAQANGDSLILISARWTDPATAQLLVEATVETYLDYVVTTVAADSLAAEEFFTQLQERASVQANEAQQELDAYVSRLPPIRPDEQRTVEQEFDIARLSNALERAQTNVENATAEIEAAQLEVAKSRSEAGQSIRVIDPAELPRQSEPWLFQAVSVTLTFLILGVLIAATALIITTALDRTVRFTPDVAEHTGSPYVTNVPVMKEIRERSKRVAATMAIDSNSRDGRDGPGDNAGNAPPGAAGDDVIDIDDSDIDGSDIDDSDDSDDSGADDTATANRRFAKSKGSR